MPWCGPMLFVCFIIFFVIYYYYFQDSSLAIEGRPHSDWVSEQSLITMVLCCDMTGNPIHKCLARKHTADIYRLKNNRKSGSPGQIDELLKFIHTAHVSYPLQLWEC